MTQTSQVPRGLALGLKVLWVSRRLDSTKERTALINGGVELLLLHLCLLVGRSLVTTTNVLVMERIDKTVGSHADASPVGHLQGTRSTHSGS